MSSLVLLLMSMPLAAQTLTGPFEPANSWWIHPQQGTGGVSRNAGNIFIDRDGDGTTETSYNIPNLGPQAFPVNIAMTPTREILVAFGGSCPSGGAPVYFFDTSTPPTLTIIDSACIENGIGDMGFYDTYRCEPTGIGGVGLVCPPTAVSPQRIAYVRDGSNQGRNQVYWFDLVNGEHRTTFPGFNRGFPFHRIEVSPYGDVAFVQHGATGSSPPSSDYTLVNLCPGPTFGAALTSNVGGALFDLPATDTGDAEMIQSGSDYFIRVSHNALTGGSDDFPFTPCGGGGGEETGACCFTDSPCTEDTFLDCEAAGGSWLGPNSDCMDCVLPGACCFTTSCISNLTEAECNALTGGTWIGALSTCADCDILDLDITKTASSGTVQEGTVLEYTLSFSNVGDVNASGVIVTDVIPVGSTYAASSNGGTYNNANRTVTWNLPGTVSPGDGGSVSLQVRANCGTAQLQNSNYRVIANGVTFVGTPAVITPVVAADANPVTISVASAPARDPLQRGDLVTHTISLMEAGGVARSNLSLSTSLGSNTGFEQVIDAAGGVTNLNGSSLSWTGSLAANATINVVFTTRVSPCASGSPGGVQLNFGNSIQVRNACGLSLGSATPPAPISIITPMRARMIALPPISPPQFNSIGQSATQFARVGATFDLQMTLSNQLSDNVPATSVNFVIPAGYSPVMDPPFIAPSDPGASYDSGSRRISWTGAVAGNSSIQITVRVMHSDPDACSVRTFVNGSTGSCNDVSFSHEMLFVPEPPSESHLLGLFANIGGFANLWTYRPGIDSLAQELLCMGHEILVSLERMPSGDIWVMGLPMFRINPETLDFRIFPDDLAETFGITPFGNLDSAAHDPADGTVVISGANQGVGGGQLKIVRYDESTESHSMIFDGATFVPQVRNTFLTRMLIDPDGRIACVALLQGGANRLIRIDPASPMSYQSFSLSTCPNPSTAALSNDGNYLVADFGSGLSPIVVAHVDRTTGAETVLLPDLRTLLPGAQYVLRMRHAPDGTIFAVVAFGATRAAYAITLDPAPAAAPLPVGVPTDIQWVDLTEPPPVPGDLDDDGDVDGDDWTMFMSAFGTSDGDPGFNGGADMDGDGDIDCDDYRLFREAWRPARPPNFAPCPGTIRGGPPNQGSNTATGATGTSGTLLGADSAANCGPVAGASMTLTLAPLILCGARARRRQGIDQLE